MGYDPAILHREQFASKLTAPERAKLGVQTAAEATQRHAARLEKRMHEQFEQWLGLHRDKLYWDHSRMDRATRNRPGHPDFVIQREGKALNVEFKCLGSKLSEKQCEVHAWIEQVRGWIIVCYSTEQAIKVTREIFCITP